MRTVRLGDEYTNKICELERLHYEVSTKEKEINARIKELTKERVIALAIQMSNTPIDEGVMNHYMEEYTNVYIEYERAKEHFYNDVVVNLMQDGDMSWELNFEAKAVTFYA